VVLEQAHSSALSEEPVHDVQTDEAMIRMPEGRRNSAENCEPERLPQANRVDVRLDNSVELHREVALLHCNFQYPVCKGTSDAPATRRRRNHETRIRDMTASRRLIRVNLGGTHNRATIDSNQHPTARLTHPPGPCGILTGVPRPAVCVAGRHNRLHNAPDIGPVGIDGVSDLHQ
jgi:hypothetical protein